MMRFHPLLLLALLSWSSLGLAADVVFAPDEPEHNLGYLVKISKLKPGDHVFFLSQDQRSIQFDYVLGKFLGEGEMGRVFEVKNADGTLSALKIRKRGKLQKQMMLAEVDAHTKLEQAGINTPAPVNWDSRIVVEKEFVDGPTLRTVAKNWSTYSSDVQKLMIQDLTELSAKLLNSPWGYSDLHTGNISWDRATQHWSVLDPGSAFPGKDGLLIMPAYERELKRDSKAMNRAFSIARQNPEWLDTALNLEKTVETLRRGPTPEGVAELREIAKRDASQAPREYQKLLWEGRSLAEEYLPREEWNKSFLSCVLSRIMKTK
jgi:serine/threonine-protein kinase RIO1